MKKLVLFIHGLGGSAGGTWQGFPELMRKDAELTKLYEVDTIEYSTGVFGSKPSLATCAAILKTEIENRYPSYSEIALIAHSQGGLVARYYIAERLLSGQPLPVSRLLTFATPHQGAGLATLLKWVPLSSQQIGDLDPNSEFMRELGVAWGQAKADRRVLTKHVVAAGDAIVGQVSSMGSWSPSYEVVAGDGHRRVVKPETAGHTSFLIAKKFLLEDLLQAGGVEADYTVPLLSLPFLPSMELTRFTFSARSLPFIGREAEQRTLADFLDVSDQMFRWMVMSGSGGVGKSRLALELCRAVRDEWHAGFLQDGEADPVWGKWQPLMPTLIVIDAAARDVERTGKVLRALAGRGPAYGTARLAAPVRALLIERIGEGEWLKKLMGDETKKKQLELARAPNLALTTIDDPWPIFEYVLKEKGKPLPDKAETLAALAAIDSERRPQFAHFMADAIARGVDIRHLDAARLLEEVIEHGRESYWKPAGATAMDERLLAVATMAGGLPVSAVKAVKDELLPSWNIDHHPKVFLAMTGRSSGQNIAPLEPDIVGEHFALACLAWDGFPNPVQDRTRLCELGWRLNPLGMAQFMLRAHRDLPADPMLNLVRKSPACEGESQLAWSLAGVDLMIDLRSRDPDAAEALLEDMRGLAVARDEATLWESWAMAAATRFGGDLPSLMHNSVLSGPIGIQTEPSGKQTFFYENRLVTGDPGAARVLLDNMRNVAAARDEIALWKTWSYAALGLMDDLASSDPIAAWTLLGDVLSVTAAKHDDEDFLSLWQPMVMNIVNAAAPTWLSKTYDVAAARDEAPLWEQWAQAALYLAKKGGPIKVRALLDDMRGMAERRNDATLWELWAQAAFSLINDLRSSDPVAARALLDDMHGLAEARNEAVLWDGWATASTVLIVDLGSSDPVASRTLVNDMLTAVLSHPGEVGGWQTKVVGLILHAAFSLTKDLGSRDPDAARAFCVEVLGLPEWLLQKMKFGD
jgi:pimeloyl-ACP methyl ester carboxylesterase